MSLTPSHRDSGSCLPAYAAATAGWLSKWTRAGRTYKFATSWDLSLRIAARLAGWGDGDGGGKSDTHQKTCPNSTGKDNTRVSVREGSIARLLKSYYHFMSCGIMRAQPYDGRNTYSRYEQ